MDDNAVDAHCGDCGILDVISVISFLDANFHAKFTLPSGLSSNKMSTLVAKISKGLATCKYSERGTLSPRQTKRGDVS
jgi:hypothetical protein